MSDEYPILGIPAIRENPFQSRPLEARNSDLFVGRSKLSTTWVRFLKSRTARLNLLIGESGTGRTSLMRCIASETQKYLHLDMYPTENHVARILDEIYTKFVDFDIPSNGQELVDRLVAVTEESNEGMPLITFDYPNADGEQLANIIANLLPALERLKAMVVVILSVNQRAQWKENLIEKFEHLEVIDPFTKEEVREICELRINKVSNVAWNITDEALNFVFEASAGKASKVIRTMRDIVDFERDNPREIKFEEEKKIVIETDIEQNSDVEINIKKSDFDLDLEKLQEQTKDIERPMVSDLPPVPAMSYGGFGGLVSRNRVNMHVDTRFDENTERNPLDIQSDESDFWQAEASDAVLITEEEPDEISEEAHFEEEIQIDEEIYEPMIESSTNGESNGNLEQVVLDLFGKILSNPNNQGVETLSQLLMNLNTPVIGRKESNPLNIHILRNLGRNEAVLVEVSTQREFSPSDPRLQDQLGIKRPRMSQICNKLYRAGILSVQQKGKSRVFKLTNDARGQLIAWGMMEAEA